MPTFDTFPDAEAVASGRLRDEDIPNLLKRVYSSVPKKDPTYPLAVVQRLGGVPAERHRLDAARIQVDVWGALDTQKSTIRAVAEAARRALHELEGGTVNEPVDAFVSGVADSTGLTWLPDPLTDRPRYTFSVVLYLHSAPAGS